VPKKIAPAEYEMILDTVRQHPDGASREMIQSVLGEPARRTLQRRLSEIVKQGRLAIEGRTRGALYRLPESRNTVQLTGVSAKGEAGQPAAEIYVPMSAEGSRLATLCAVRSPCVHRSATGANSCSITGPTKPGICRA
jgi:hypothetical protein